MALLRVLRRGRFGSVIGSHLRAATLLALALSGCEPQESEFAPDARLVEELGLSPDSEVHTVAIVTGVGERADPDSLQIRPGAYLQFVSDDWFVHELAFDTATMEGPARDFLRSTGQITSPPLLQRGARFVLTFQDAPEGRYPYRLEGNRGPGSGLIVVARPPSMP